jgi:predicted GIY-YIG superfamily endonuclease
VEIARRVKEHVAGNVISTKGLLPVKLVFSQEYVDLVSARNVERRLKKLKRRDYIEAIIREGRINMRP